MMSGSLTLSKRERERETKSVKKVVKQRKRERENREKKLNENKDRERGKEMIFQHLVFCLSSPPLLYLSIRCVLMDELFRS